MYIIKNAFRCIRRAKGRNLLIGAVVLVLSVSSCIGLSIKEANKTLKKQYADNMEISATVNPKNMRESGISLDTLKELAGDKSVKDFYYSANIYFAAGDGIEPLDVAGSFKQNKDFKEEHGNVKNGEEITESATSEVTGYKAVALVNNETEQIPEQPDDTEETESGDGEKTQQPDAPQSENNESETGGQSQMPAPPEGGNGSGSGGGMPDGGRQGGDTFITNKFFFNMASMNDFTVVGYYADKAIPDYIHSLNVLDTDSEDFNCVISKNLAEENELAVGDTFTLKNPDNEEESYTFTVAGICDTSESQEEQDTASNASFSDNFISISGKALNKILSDSAALNSNEDKALTATYSGTFTFANLKNYNAFSKGLADDYRLVSGDVENYEQSVSQLETLGKYATYFLIVIFVIGAFVLIIINLFSIRSRKYEIGVLTAIGMKKYKVAAQFVTELFVVTFAALIIGSAAGAVTSVPVTNSLLKTVNTTQTKEENTKTDKAFDGNEDMPTPPQGGQPDGFGERMDRFGGKVNNYVAQISGATDMTVIFQMVLVGLGLTLVSSMAAVTFVMRYEPLKILSDRD